MLVSLFSSNKLKKENTFSTALTRDVSSLKNSHEHILSLK